MKSSRSTSPGCTGSSRSLRLFILSSMIIHYLHMLRVGAAPNETNPPLPVNSDAVLSSAAAFQGFQSVAWRRQQIAQHSRPVQVFELTPRGVLNVRRQLAG